MATPVISASSSILGFKRNESFEFQPSATGSPTSWAAVGLPAGVSINGSTGKIYGSASVAGVYVVTVSATNSLSEMGTREFVIGIASEAAATVASSDVSCEWDMDVVTRLLSKLQAAAAATGSTPDESVLGYWKKDDSFLLRLRFRKNGVVVDPDPDVLKVVLKEYEPEKAIVLGSTFVKTGSGESAYFDVLIDLSPDAVKTALSNYEADQGTSFTALIEVQMESSITFDGSATTIRISSRTGKVQLDRDLVD